MQNQVPQNTPRPCFDKNADLADRDEDRLRFALVEYCGVPENTAQDPHAYDDHDIVRALLYAGVNCFWNGFVMLTERDIENLVVPPTSPRGDPRELTTFNRRMLICFSAYYHDVARTYGRRINVHRLDMKAFGEYRISKVRPNPIVPFGIPLASSPTAMTVWEKSIRQSKSDFKEFRLESD